MAGKSMSPLIKQWREGRRGEEGIQLTKTELTLKSGKVTQSRVCGILGNAHIGTLLTAKGTQDPYVAYCVKLHYFICNCMVS